MTICTVKFILFSTRHEKSVTNMFGMELRLSTFQKGKF